MEEFDFGRVGIWMPPLWEIVGAGDLLLASALGDLEDTDRRWVLLF